MVCSFVKKQKLIMNQTNTSNLTIAIYWMLLTLLSFALMAVAVKELSGQISTAEILFFRSVFALIIIAPFIYHGGVRQLKTKQISKHLSRSLFHFAGQYGWVYGIAFIPLAEVFALEFTVPIWTAIIAMIFLKEKATLTRIISISLGVVGVLIILQPTSKIIHPAALFVLFSAIGYAIAHNYIKSLSRDNTALTIVFYMAAFQLPIGAIASFSHWVMPQGIMWLWLFIIGLTSIVGHFCLAKAMTKADAMVVVPIDFLRLPLIMIVGVVLYNENIEWYVFLGAIIMLIGNIVNIKFEPKKVSGA
jgi:drug/metabolite transporter (DMT)-like permease